MPDWKSGAWVKPAEARILHLPPFMIEKFREIVSACYGDSQPRVIAEIGGHRGETTLEFACAYPSTTILACEGDPDNFCACRMATKQTPNIIVLPVAVSEQNGLITFYKSITNNTGNGGLYRPSGLYEQHEHMEVQPIVVPSLRLDSVLAALKLCHADALWLDAQGSELSILRSLGKLLSQVRVIWTEYSIQPMYTGQPLVRELDNFLLANKFKPVVHHVELSDWWGNVCYVKC